MKKEYNRDTTVLVDAQVTEKSDVVQREEEILAFWRANNIFNKSVETPAGKTPVGDFVFYDGPPFATGTPHYGHILAGTIKDAIPRFWTMNGYRVQRKWGWDCHGLPLENIIEKRLGLATKRDIEALGVQKFNESAREAVLEYADDWKQVVPRMGRFVDMEDDYRTMDSTYTESVWWVFSELNKKGLVYEGFKTMHLCPRCGTTLSNFEVNQGYKDIKDIAVTVKMPLLDDADAVTDTSLLIWTTTPWTLPGNMAIAVHKDIEYVKVRVSDDEKDEFVILAKGRLTQLSTDTYEVIEEIKGDDLIGKSYKPPFETFTKQEFANKENAWKIYHADYVEVGTEGTGAVHIAPAYGEEDMELAKREDVPVMHHVDENGRFKDFVPHFGGQLVKPKDDENAEVSHLDADIEMVKYLKEHGSLFKKENITHSYPHCWRCDTPLLNYATTSWFVRVTDIKDKLVAENAKVQWVPEHVGTNRFGRWLEGARDWAVSRQRYWGAPLPIWKNPTTGAYKIFGSLKDMQVYVPKSGNTYLLMRHAEAESNVQGIIDSIADEQNPLTKNGEAQCIESAQKLRDKKIDVIIHSGMQRTRQTAEIIAKELGISSDRIHTDERMFELQTGIGLEGKTWEEYEAQFVTQEEKFTKEIDGIENRTHVMKRVGDFLYDIEHTYKDKTILVVGHASSTFAFRSVAEGADMQRAMEIRNEGYMKNAEFIEVPFTPLPHNDIYVLDFHRPYIDNHVLVDTDGTRLVRVPDVFDCWFESGAMPYAQNHYPFENLETFNPEKGIGFPAQFIAEGLDQTRGWFYSLIVLGTALFGKSPYEQVVVNGLVLAEDGKKMSKSLQNYPDPMELVHRIGADAVRMYLLTSPVVRGEDFSFSEKEVLELQRKNIGRLHNVLAMYEMFADGTHAGTDSPHVLDRWVIARLNYVIAEATNGYKKYELDKATRPLTDFIDDVSVWYLRRSRDRLKGENREDKAFALATLRFILRELAKVMAPVMPFYAEYLFLRVREESDAESVHLSTWPEGGEVDGVLVTEMQRTREIVTKSLEARAKANIKVRQPLNSITINVSTGSEYEALIKDEVNVKTVLFDAREPFPVLDIIITPELKREGDVRELMRAVQDTRKNMGLNPKDRVILVVDDALRALIAGFEPELIAVVGAHEIIAGNEGGASVTIEGATYSFGVVKV